jgi:CP family cyanate transporter-like MFS transporter
MWLATSHRAHRSTGVTPVARPTSARGMIRSRRAWSVVAFTATQSVVYYSLLAWMPTIYHDRGIGSATAGLLLSATTLISAPAAILVASIGARRLDQTSIVYGIVAASATGLLGLLLWTRAAPLLWAALIGLGQGGAFALALTFFVVRTATGEQTAALSMLAQGIGYVVAASGPLVTGLLHSATGGWTAALWLLVAMVGLQLVTGRASARPGFVTAEPRQPEPPTAYRPLDAAIRP